MESYFARPCTLWYKSARVWRRRGELRYLCGLVILVYIWRFFYLWGRCYLWRSLLHVGDLDHDALALAIFGGPCYMFGGSWLWCASFWLRLGDDSWLMCCYLWRLWRCLIWLMHWRLWRWFLEDDDALLPWWFGDLVGGYISALALEDHFGISLGWLEFDIVLWWLGHEAWWLETWWCCAMTWRLTWRLDIWLGLYLELDLKRLVYVSWLGVDCDRWCG